MLYNPCYESSFLTAEKKKKKKKTSNVHFRASARGNVNRSTQQPVEFPTDVNVYSKYIMHALISWISFDLKIKKERYYNTLAMFVTSGIKFTVLYSDMSLQAKL